jgi:hypothetical protein
VLADVTQVQAIAAVATANCHPASLRREQLSNQDMGPILEEVTTRQHSEWKDVTDCSPMYESYWAQWKSLAVRNCVLECHWESTDRQTKVAQIFLPQSRLNDMLTKLHGGSSGGHLVVNKALNKVQQGYYWLQAKNDVEK